jgi:hypothetical protein
MRRYTLLALVVGLLSVGCTVATPTPQPTAAPTDQPTAPPTERTAEVTEAAATATPEPTAPPTEEAGFPPRPHRAAPAPPDEFVSDSSAFVGETGAPQLVEFFTFW